MSNGISTWIGDMSDELKAKLVKILLPYSELTETDIKEAAIRLDDVFAQVAQAYKDAGYGSIEDHRKQLKQWISALGFMTGQEYYERFERELAGMGDGGMFLDPNLVTPILYAAKRAAGLE